MTEILKTPDECFAGLKDFPFAPHYTDVGGLSMHYVDEGSGRTILLLHGEPSWSYLYRKMIPPLVKRGFRVIAPDLIGFGKSSKPADQAAYTYQTHMDWMTAFLLNLDLRKICLFCQDWGGLIGLRLAAENADRFDLICAANTFLPTGDISPSEAFFQWRDFSQKVSRLPVGRVIKNGCVTELSSEEVAAYNAPFPEEKYKAGARKFPMLVPVSTDDPATPANKKAWEVLKKWEKPFLNLFSDSDPLTRGGDAIFRRVIPGTKNQPHETITGAGHFLQEDKGPQIAQKLADWIEKN